MDNKLLAAQADGTITQEVVDAEDSMATLIGALEDGDDTTKEMVFTSLMISLAAARTGADK
jgi:hypothetical protein